ncbi:MAG: acetyl-CoA carboxylase biotin carboxylase subunit [Desulfobacteraceae bacterium]|jgi:acetyl-CoA carboxylase biotin carboxylase subunit|nr:MAG: acetyl-CoA carboxylase biotin carboxylase subunit [Desulfobacteraceae bacterium]
MGSISRVFVANRGEIALRIIRACREMGIESVLGVSNVDKNSLPAKMADRVVCIGPHPPLQSYLKVGTLITAALGTGADAIHPGYGFLAEQPELGEACMHNGLIFIGPKPENIRQMGDKLVAREMVRDLGVPVIPGSELVHDAKEAGAMAEKVGFPVLLKAAAGGGGKGMKMVRNPSELKSVFEEASAEARAAFGDDRIYIEHLIANARHIEVQILADRYGNVIHLFERDCSLQRRYQKMVEEAPSPAVTSDMREKITQAAVAIAQHVNYENAGTIEMVLDQDQGKFYFLEMNTRIQVEHPVTEMITGKDLVKEQIRIASGNPISFTQEEISIKGHAVECRINAEKPDANFMPHPGRILSWTPPEGHGIRIDSHCYSGYFVPPYYDSLLAKLITTGVNRSKAIHRMEDALANFDVKGVETTIPFYRKVMNHPDYLNGRIHTRWVEEVFLNR